MYQEGKRIVILPNNTLVIHDANVNDTSDDYECSIMHPKKTVTIKHRVQVVSQVPPTQRVDVTSERPQVLSTDTQRMDAASERPQVPPSIHHKQSEIRVIPGKRVEVNAGDNVTLGCETRIQPIPEIKWYHEVRYFYSTPYYVHIYRRIHTFQERKCKQKSYIGMFNQGKAKIVFNTNFCSRKMLIFNFHVSFFFVTERKSS